jgi:hypothetical protein
MTLENLRAQHLTTTGAIHQGIDGEASWVEEEESSWGDHQIILDSSIWSWEGSPPKEKREIPSRRQRMIEREEIGSGGPPGQEDEERNKMLSNKSRPPDSLSPYQLEPEDRDYQPSFTSGSGHQSPEWSSAEEEDEELDSPSEYQMRGERVDWSQEDRSLQDTRVGRNPNVVTFGGGVGEEMGEEARIQEIEIDSEDSKVLYEDDHELGHMNATRELSEEEGSLGLLRSDQELNQKDDQVSSTEPLETDQVKSQISQVEIQEGSKETDHVESQGSNVEIQEGSKEIDHVESQIGEVEIQEGSKEDPMEVMGRAMRDRVPKEMTIEGTVKGINFKERGVHIKWLIDTGAERSFISSRFFGENLKEQVVLVPPVVKVSAINGSAIRVEGSCTVILEFGNKQWSQEVVVAEIEDAGVLGMDFLEKYQCRWNKGKAGVISQEKLGRDTPYGSEDASEVGQCQEDPDKEYLRDGTSVSEPGRLEKSGSIKVENDGIEVHWVKKMHSDINPMEKTLDEDADFGDNNVQELVRRALRSKAPQLTTNDGKAREVGQESAHANIQWLINTGAKRSFISQFYKVWLPEKIELIPNAVKMPAINGSQVTVVLTRNSEKEIRVLSKGKNIALFKGVEVSTQGNGVKGVLGRNVQCHASTMEDFKDMMQKWSFKLQQLGDDSNNPTSGCSNEHASELPPPEPPPGDGYESE